MITFTRKGWGTCRSPKSYNLSFDCPPCLVFFKMVDKISMSQRALPKVTSQRYISSQRYIPNNVTLKKRQKPSAFYCIIVRCFWHVLDPKQWFFCQITYVKLLLELSFLRVKGSTVILRARTSWSARFDHKCTLFALLVLYIILDIYLLFKVSKSCMECFCVGNKKRTANSNTVILFFFFSSLDLTGPLLLDGLVQQPVIFPVLYKHFTGCIRNVYIDHKFLDLSQPLYNNGTSAKCKAMGNTCAYKPCERGTCFNILGSRRCDCPTGFDGSRCETSIEFFSTDM